MEAGKGGTILTLSLELSNRPSLLLTEISRVALSGLGRLGLAPGRGRDEKIQVRGTQGRDRHREEIR